MNQLTPEFKFSVKCLGFLLMAFDPNDKKAEAMGYFTQVDSTKGQFMDCWDRPKVKEIAQHKKIKLK